MRSRATSPDRYPTARALGRDLADWCRRQEEPSGLADLAEFMEPMLGSQRTHKLEIVQTVLQAPSVTTDAVHVVVTRLLTPQGAAESLGATMLGKPAPSIEVAPTLPLDANGTPAAPHGAPTPSALHAAAPPAALYPPGALSEAETAPSPVGAGHASAVGAGSPVPRRPRRV